MSGGFGGLNDVLDGIEHARSAGLDPIKINAVIQRGLNDHTALGLVERFRGTGVIVRFIEYMDVGNRNEWKPDIVVPSKELVARISERWPLQPLERDYRGEVAERYSFVDGAGEVGFIFVCHPTFLRRLFQGTVVLRRSDLHMPVCEHRHQLARRIARWRNRRAAS